MEFPAGLHEQLKQVDSDYFPDSSRAKRPDTSAAASAAISRENALLSEGECSNEEETEFHLSTRQEDEVEERFVDDFVAKGCGCLLRCRCLKSPLVPKCLAIPSYLLHIRIFVRCLMLS